MTAPQTTSASYEVGYRKPPRYTQFQKGQSGNPGGRPRRPARRLEELALYEAYRTTIVMEDDHAMPMPAIQAVLRRQLESATSGNVRAQRDILTMIRDIERVRSVASLFDDGGADDVVGDTDDADAIDADDNDVDDTADADRDDAGGADERKQADGIDTHAERRQDMGARLGLDGAMDSSPPPCGEGSGVGVEPGGITVPHGTTPHPDPPPAETAYTRVSATELSDRNRQQPISIGGRESARLERTAPPPAVSAPQPEDAAAPPAGRTPPLPSGSGSGQRRGVLPRRNGPEWSAGVQPARPQPGRRRRSPAVNAGKIRERHCGSSRRSLGRTNPGPGPAQAAGGHARARPPLRGETKN
jgi:Family of unknown function (DUF5681)